MRRLLLALLGIALLAPASAGAATFSNPTQVTLPESGPADPYPSEISVRKVPGPVVKVRVTLVDVLAAAWNVDALLVGPGGSTILTSDACLNTDFGHIDLTFDDDAAAPLGPGPCPGLTSGTFKPTNYDTTDSFPGLAPGPYPLGLSNLRGGPASGAWRLYVVDDQYPDGGSIGGWRLELTAGRCGGRQATITGTAGSELLRGTPGADVIVGLGGNDRILGLSGKDIVCGGPGRDRLLGGPGRDRLFGGPGRDRLRGQSGRDVCKGGPGRDRGFSCERSRSV